MSDVSIHTHIPIIGKQYDLRMRERKIRIEIRSSGEDNWSITARANDLATEELPELLHAALHQVLLAEVVTQGHVGQFRFLFLYLKQARFDRILNDQLDRGHGPCLTETVL